MEADRAIDALICSSNDRAAWLGLGVSVVRCTVMLGGHGKPIAV